MRVLFPFFFCHMLLFTELGTGRGSAASSPSELIPINASNCIPTNSISCLILIESASDTVKPSISPVTFGKAMDKKLKNSPSGNRSAGILDLIKDCLDHF